MKHYGNGSNVVVFCLFVFYKKMPSHKNLVRVLTVDDKLFNFFFFMQF